MKENTYSTDIREVTGTTDENGRWIVPGNTAPNDHQYLITVSGAGLKKGGAGPASRAAALDKDGAATKKDGDATARFAFLGFTGMWCSPYQDIYDHEYKRERAFVMTDRPVYRPGQTVKWKLWVNTSKYDKDSKSEFAGQSLGLNIKNPKGDMIFSESKAADGFGGIAGEFKLEKGATLGVYQIYNPNRGGGNLPGGGVQEAGV